MKKTILFLSVFIILFSSGCNNEKKEETSISTEYVYVNPEGEKYHKEYCRYVDNDSIKMPLSEAKESYTPCKVCYGG